MKAKKEDLYTIMLSTQAQAILASAFSSTDPSSALGELARLLKGKITLRCEVVEYSRSTGKPIRYGWKPFEKWDGRLWFSPGNYPSLDKNAPLYEPLRHFLPIGKTIIMKSGGDNVIVRHVPSEMEDGLQGGGTVPDHLEFAKAE